MKTEKEVNEILMYFHNLNIQKYRSKFTGSITIHFREGIPEVEELHQKKKIKLS